MNTATTAIRTFNAPMVAFLSRALVAHVKTGGSLIPASMRLVAGWHTRSREEREAAMEAACATFKAETGRELPDVAYENGFVGTPLSADNVALYVGAEYAGGYMYPGFKGWLDLPDGTAVRIKTACHWVRQHGRDEETEEGREQVRTAPVGSILRMTESNASGYFSSTWERTPKGYVCLSWYEEKN